MRPDVEQLAEVGRAAGGGGEPAVLYDRHGVLVVRVGDVVVKSHQEDREAGDALARRLVVAAALPGIALPPLAPPRTVDGTAVTVWPYGEPVAPERPPWADAGRLLAALHRADVPDGTPQRARRDRVERLVARLGDGEDADTVRAAFRTLKPEQQEEHTSLVHGDWHLGQLVNHQNRWLLIDVEDLGTGDPAWDLARPAALYLGGVLAPAAWNEFVTAYRAAGGPVADGDDATLWTRLDEPARTLAIQIAATCVQSAREQHREPDTAEAAMVAACGRIAAMATGT
ncbi:phosphotransferase family protein [Actinomadura atramentaria]|uniref:phosphotransferase family protein n=1 Tax=Actinomadura atramentaria TaxID=1990 RepID=UPI00037EA97F|nr:phosphotransferase [Actinomadura atramentaria]